MHRESQKNPTHSAKASQDKCTTTFVAGIPLLQCLRFAEGNTSSPILVEMVISGSCCHLEGKDIGILNGYARKKMKEEVSTIMRCSKSSC